MENIKKEKNLNRNLICYTKKSIVIFKKWVKTTNKILILIFNLASTLIWYFLIIICTQDNPSDKIFIFL